MLSNNLRPNFCYLKIIHILYRCYSPKILENILKNKQKNKCVCIHENMRLNIMKMNVKKKNRPHRYNMNKPRSRHGHKCSKCKKCLIMMMLICIKQNLSNIWSSNYEKVKQHLGRVEKSLFIKNACSFFRFLMYLELAYNQVLNFW